MTELTDLIGEHMLDAVDFSTEQIKQYSWDTGTVDAAACRFRLDGVTYVAMEDPSDGYRSSMDDLTVLADARMENVFPAIRVSGRHRIKGDYSQIDDVLELVDMVTGKVVLEVGTTNTDDYYPSYVACFSPENMATNIGVAA